jgi:hypothetical protein
MTLLVLALVITLRHVRAPQHGQGTPTTSEASPDDRAGPPR